MIWGIRKIAIQRASRTVVLSTSVIIYKITEGERNESEKDFVLKSRYLLIIYHSKCGQNFKFDIGD